MRAAAQSIRQPSTSSLRAQSPRLSSLPPEVEAPKLLGVFPTGAKINGFETLLEVEGYVPHIASTVTEFWQSLAGGLPDLVLVPDILRDMSALELCGELRMRRSTQLLSIITVMCGPYDEQFVVRSLRAGADDSVCLQRPDELRARVAAQLRNNRYRQMLRHVRSERDVLRVAATIDPLTRIPNRRALDRTMRDRVDRSERFAVLFLDLDHFKRINDRFGHDVGDEVLKRVGRYLERGIRSNDFCGRYGGEEFLVVVDGADEPLAAKIAERHRRAISGIEFDRRKMTERVTVSVGVAAFDPSTGQSVEDVLKSADEALYRAKAAGRNQVKLASDPAEGGEPAPEQGIDTTLEALRASETALLARLEAKSASLPVLPEIATQALMLANDPNADLQRFARLVDRDPHLAARFLSTANSVIYRRGIKTTTTGAALVRVGLEGARDILFQMVYSASTVGLPRHQVAVSQSFGRSVLAGLAASRGVRLLKLRFPFAYLAGLLHDIGEALVYRILANLPQELTEEQADCLVQRHHCRAGAILAKAWSLPQEIVQVCEWHHDPAAASEGVRLVRFADAAVRQVMPRDEDTEVASEVPWFEPFGLSAHEADALIGELRSAKDRLETERADPRRAML